MCLTSWLWTMRRSCFKSSKNICSAMVDSSSFGSFAGRRSSTNWLNFWIRDWLSNEIIFLHTKSSKVSMNSLARKSTSKPYKCLAHCSCVRWEGMTRLGWTNLFMCVWYVRFSTDFGWLMHEFFSIVEFDPEARLNLKLLLLSGVTCF